MRLCVHQKSFCGGQCRRYEFLQNGVLLCFLYRVVPFNFVAPRGLHVSFRVKTSSGVSVLTGTHLEQCTRLHELGISTDKMLLTKHMCTLLAKTQARQLRIHDAISKKQCIVRKQESVQMPSYSQGCIVAPMKQAWRIDRMHAHQLGHAAILNIIAPFHMIAPTLSFHFTCLTQYTYPSMLSNSESLHATRISSRWLE